MDCRACLVHKEEREIMVILEPQGKKEIKEIQDQLDFQEALEKKETLEVQDQMGSQEVKEIKEMVAYQDLQVKKEAQVHREETVCLVCLEYREPREMWE